MRLSEPFSGSVSMQTFTCIAAILLIQHCILVSSDYMVTSDDTHDSEFRVIEPVDRPEVSDETLLTEHKGRTLNLSVVRGWGIFLIVVLCIVVLCVCVFVACKLFTRSSRGLMDRIYPGVHVTKENEAISTGRCTRINF